jgi:hypothetical protein
MFRMYSPTRLVAQAIYYRDLAGGFTMSKQEAACMSGRPDWADAVCRRGAGLIGSPIQRRPAPARYR